SIVFSPTAGGARSALLVITSNVPGSPQTLTLTGTAAPPLPEYVVADLGAIDGVPPQSMQTGVYGLNDAGVVVGQWNLPNTHSHAFLADASGMHSLGALADPLVESCARGINDSGQTVGYTQSLVDHTTHAFLYSGGVLQDLGTLGGSFGAA